MTEQNILGMTEAQTLLEDPRFGLGQAWRAPALAQVLSCSGPFENAPALGNAIRVFMSARTTPTEIDRFIKLWTASNALRNHITARFEAAQAAHLHLEPSRLPKRYRIQTMDYASLGAFAVLIDPEHPLPSFGTLRSQAFRDAERALDNLADDLLRECKRNPRGVLAQLTEAPCTPASSTPHANGAKTTTATEEVFALAKGLELSPLVFVMLVAAYELRNGLVHGSIPLPLLPDEQRDELAALDLCSCVLDAFLDQTLPQAVQQVDTGDGRLAPFPERSRQTIVRHLDHRFDRRGIISMLRKHGLI